MMNLPSQSSSGYCWRKSIHMGIIFII